MNGNAATSNLRYCLFAVLLRSYSTQKDNFRINKKLSIFEVRKELFLERFEVEVPQQTDLVPKIRRIL